MKIAQVCHRYHPHVGGIQIHVKEISERLVKRGFEAEVLTTDPSGKLPKEEIISNVRVRRFKSWAPNEAFYFSEDLRRFLMNNSSDYDIVHAHNYHAFPALYAAQAKNRNKLVVTSHYHGGGQTFFRNLLHIPYKFLGKSIFMEADRIICVSDYEKSLIENHFKIDKEKIEVIPNGLNLQEFKDMERRKKDYRAILYVGRLEKYKNIQYLIKALPKLDKDIILEIVGKGPYKKSLVKLARNLRVEGRVRFFQDLSRNELLQRYADADLFALLSKHEAYGISVAEALASKTPCIVADTSALKEWVNNENCFGINNPVNLDELVNIINNVITMRFRRSVSRLRLHDWDEVSEKLVDLYKLLLDIV